MGADYRVSQIYEEVLQRVTTTEEIWKSVCRMAGQIYRYEFDNVLMVYGQKPNATLVADYDSWKKVNRYVKRGSKGIAIYPSRALKPYMRYVFDLSDTGGVDKKLTWNLDESNLAEYLNFLNCHKGLELQGEAEFLTMQQEFWDFTKEEIKSIIKENHAMREEETLQMLVQELQIAQVEHAQEVAEELMYHSIYYAVATRCNLCLVEEEEDLKNIPFIKGEEAICALGGMVSDVSCELLRGINRNMIAM